MKHLLLGTLLFITLSAEKCNTDKAGTTGQLADIRDNKWVVTAVGENAVLMPEGMEAPWLKLGKEGNNIEGNGGCNALMGTFNLEGDKISFPGMGSTKKYCESTMSIENALLAALKRVDQFKVDGSTLKLLGAGQQLITLTGEK